MQDPPIHGASQGQGQSASVLLTQAIEKLQAFKQALEHDSGQQSSDHDQQRILQDLSKLSGLVGIDSGPETRLTDSNEEWSNQDRCISTNNDSPFDHAQSESSHVRNKASTRSVTQKDLEFILHRLQDDLIAVIHTIIPYACSNCRESWYGSSSSDSSLETAIKSCVESTLNSWTPIPETNSLESSNILWYTGISESNSNLLPIHDLGLTRYHGSPEEFRRPIDLGRTMDSDQLIVPTDNRATESPDHRGKTAPDTKQANPPLKTSRLDWEKHKDILRKLYCEENKTLSEVRMTMDKKYSFRATTRQYRYILGGKWGFRKYNLNAAHSGSDSPRTSRRELSPFRVAPGVFVGGRHIGAGNWRSHGIDSLELQHGDSRTYQYAEALQNESDEEGTRSFPSRLISPTWNAVSSSLPFMGMEFEYSR
ncbi:Clr5 domain-containing protein [Nemania sp. FL0916]|nr:Clr5 domain-containing protein [Nemania sp. FL0916]